MWMLDLSIGQLICISLCWLVYTSTCCVVWLGPSYAWYRFCKWRGICFWRRKKKILRALFCATLLYSLGGYPECQMVWCRSCYIKRTSDIFQVNYLIDEYGNLVYDCDSDASRYKVGMYGAHLMGPFQWNLCVFCTLYHRNLIQVLSDEENLTIIRCINMDSIWSI